MTHTKESLSNPHLFMMVEAYNERKRLILPSASRCNDKSERKDVTERLERAKAIQRISGGLLALSFFAGVAVVVVAALIETVK